MQAQGEHLLVRKPRKPDASEGGIAFPDNYDVTYAYGRVVTMGAKCADMIGLPDDPAMAVEPGSIVAYDSMGARELELHPRDDANLVVIHASQVYCTLVEKQLEKRKLPIPE